MSSFSFTCDGDPLGRLTRYRRCLFLGAGVYLAALALTASPALAEPDPHGTTVTVCPAGRADFATITGALASPDVADGAILQLCAGTFAEGPVTIGKSVTVRGAGSERTIITASSPSSATHSVIIVPITPPVQVTMTDVRITGGATTCVCGGGITVGDTADPSPHGDTGQLMLRRVLIDHNSGGDGGGVLNAGGNLTVSDSVIRDNTTDGPESGGVSLFRGTSTFTRTMISGNSGNRGGGVYLANNTNATFDHDLISNNSSIRGGGGFFVSGGTSTLTVTDSIVTGNTANTGGPGEGLFGASGGGIGAEGKIVVRRTAVRGNTAQEGGGIWARDTATIEQSVITDNIAHQDGGGFWDNLGFSTSTITRTWITGNRAAGDGGGLWHGAATNPLILQNSLIQGNHADGEGGGLYLEETDRFARGGTSHAVLTRTPVVANTAPGGGGIQNEGALVLNQSPVAGNKVGDCVDEAPGTGCPSSP